MTPDEVLTLLNAALASGARRALLHCVMSVETVRDVAEACAVDLPEGWQPPPDELSTIAGIPIQIDNGMLRGSWSIVDLQSETVLVSHASDTDESSRGDHA